MSRTTDLRALQSSWLRLAEIRVLVRLHGWDRRICGPGSPTYQQVRDMELPEWQDHFEGFFEEVK